MEGLEDGRTCHQSLGRKPRLIVPSRCRHSTPQLLPFWPIHRMEATRRRQLYIVITITLCFKLEVFLQRINGVNCALGYSLRKYDQIEAKVMLKAGVLYAAVDIPFENAISDKNKHCLAARIGARIRAGQIGMVRALASCN